MLALLHGSDRKPNGQPKAKAQQVEYAFAARELEDNRPGHDHMSAVQATAPSALRVRQLWLLRWPASHSTKGRGPRRIEFEAGARLNAAR